jgi:class 3 adenylate cyclase/tetratricopeptide (TPR) repeat protein
MRSFPPPDEVKGERRPVTVVFVDVVGSTSLAEQMDPEDWATTMDRAVALLTDVVEHYGGWVASHTGDGLMALFGLPMSHEDDPSRAVSAGIDMVGAVKRYADELRPDGIDFQIRVGINSGLVVARDVAAGGATSDSRMYGDTLNVAARMQAAAPPGGIMITGETFAYVGDGIDSRRVGPIAVKGRADPVEAYEVLGRIGVLRPERGVPGLASKMVGRDAELGLLVTSLGPVQAGLGRMAVVVGEPGIGKSRLLRELRVIAEAKGFGWVEARTITYGRNLPLRLAIDLVRAAVGIPEAPESAPQPEATPLAATPFHDELGSDDAGSGPFLAHLLSMPLDVADAMRLSRMEPQTLQVRYAEGISDLIAGLARRRPLVMVCDDLHWADDASVDVLLPLLRTVSRLPVLWVLASRAEPDAPGWRLVSAATDAFGDALANIRLRPLEAEDGGRLVANLLAIDSLPSATRNMILRRADGNPLFAEEIVRTLIDSHAIESVDGRWVATTTIKDVEIPATIHGLLLARIDRLPEEARQVLRVASVVGRTFSVRVLHLVVSPSAAPAEGLGRLGDALASLEGAGLVGLVASSPYLEYQFRHALIQEAAYALLLKQERRSLHRAVATTLLALDPDRRDEQAPVLAYHYEAAEDRPNALEFLTLAARQARSRFARHEAVDFARRAVALLIDVDNTDGSAHRSRAELRLIQAEAGRDFVPVDQTLALLEAVIADGEVLGDPAMMARAYLQIAEVRATSGEVDQSSPELAAALRRAADLAAESGSKELLALATAAAGRARYMSSDFTQAIALLEDAVPLLTDAEELYEASVAAGDLGTAYGHVGNFEQAVYWTDRARDLGNTSGDPNASLDADLARSIVEGIRGNAAAAIDYAMRAAEAAERIDNKACAMVAHGLIGEQHLRDGDSTRATIAFETSAGLATFCQFMPLTIQRTELLLQSARARSGVGQVEFERYERALELARQFADPLVEAQLYEQRAADRIAAGQGAFAREDLARAAELLAKVGATPHLEHVRELEAKLESFSSS